MSSVQKPTITEVAIMNFPSSCCIFITIKLSLYCNMYLEHKIFPFFDIQFTPDPLRNKLMRFNVIDHMCPAQFMLTKELRATSVPVEKACATARCVNFFGIIVAVLLINKNI